MLQLKKNRARQIAIHTISLGRSDLMKKMAEQNGLWLDAYRTETLEDFYALAGRAKVTEVA